MKARNLARLLPLVLLLALPAAHAATVRSDGGVVTIEGGDDVDALAASVRGDQLVIQGNASLNSDGSCTGGSIGGGVTTFDCTGGRLVASLGGPNRTRIDDTGPQDNSINMSLPARVAVEVEGGPGGDDIKSAEDAADVVRAGPNLDSVSTAAGNDLIVAGEGPDEIEAGAGDDTVYAGDVAADGSAITESPAQRDIIDCGAGNDTVFADQIDTLSNCEQVTRNRGRGTEGSARLGDTGFAGGTLTVPVTCNQRARCRGTALLRSKGKTIGERDFSIGSDATADVKVKLNRKGKRLVRRPGEAKAKLLVKVTGGVPSTARVALS
jgi:hypothetical protein